MAPTSVEGMCFRVRPPVRSTDPAPCDGSPKSRIEKSQDWLRSRLPTQTMMRIVHSDGIEGKDSMSEAASSEAPLQPKDVSCCDLACKAPGQTTTGRGT